MEKISTGIVIVAGGSGRRMGSELPKQFLFLGGEPILIRTINRFAKALPGAPIVVVLPEEQRPFWENLAARFEVAVHTVATGGKERFDSVKSGLEALFQLGEGVELVAIHDGVRPLVSRELILRCLDCAARNGSAIPAVAAVDSFRRLTDEGSEVVDRSLLRAVQTPQLFDAHLLRRAYRQPFDPAFTDDASVVERLGTKITLCEGERQNLKITTREDLTIAEALLAAENEQEDGERIDL
ncbi:MAG: 2-C-methyl-D-erythritol 4-phosphate cytidylyltransferase [Rikenellaceae bacterium]|nr:2-C-methyl-D-erythritol 4-phosphate cytidylyltransferase [Rikenellaceae bacterium]